jgi:hypothetical protein
VDFWYRIDTKKIEYQSKRYLMLAIPVNWVNKVNIISLSILFDKKSLNGFHIFPHGKDEDNRHIICINIDDHEKYDKQVGKNLLLVIQDWIENEVVKLEVK